MNNFTINCPYLLFSSHCQSRYIFLWVALWFSFVFETKANTCFFWQRLAVTFLWRKVFKTQTALFIRHQYLSHPITFSGSSSYLRAIATLETLSAFRLVTMDLPCFLIISYIKSFEFNDLNAAITRHLTTKCLGNGCRIATAACPVPLFPFPDRFFFLSFPFLSFFPLHLFPAGAWRKIAFCKETRKRAIVPNFPRRCTIAGHASVFLPSTVTGCHFSCLVSYILWNACSPPRNCHMSLSTFLRMHDGFGAAIALQSVCSI